MKIKNLFSRKSIASEPTPEMIREILQKEMDDLATPLVLRAIREARQNASK